MASNYYNNYDTNDNHDDDAYRHKLIWRTGDLCVAAQHPKISYIAHQCNCTTRVAQGLAKQIFDTFPSANVYKSLEVRVCVYLPTVPLYAFTPVPHSSQHIHTHAHRMIERAL